MWRRVTQPSAEGLGRSSPSPKHAISNHNCIPTFHRGAASAAAASLDACGCSQHQQPLTFSAAWRPWRRTSRPVTAVAAENSESGTKAAGSGSSGSSSSETQRLQPKPQARIRRLAPPGSENTPSKPRRWHKTAPASKSGPGGHATSAANPQTQAPAETGSHTGQGSGAQVLDSQAAATSSDRGGQLLQPQQQRQVQRQKPGRQQQRGPGRRGQASGGPAGARGRQQPKRYGDGAGFEEEDNDDDEDEEDEDGDGEFRGLSAEELEAMVFASAGRGTDASSSGADVLGAGLPLDLEPLVEAAIRSGGVTRDGSILADQLRQLRDAAAAAATAAASGVAAAGGGDAAAAAAAAATDAEIADALQASVRAAADLLGCSTEAAAAILVNHPRYVGLLAAGGAGGQALELLRSFSGMLKLDLPQTRDVVRQNPALLLLPYEPLREKLVALANATGLSLAQATTMVSPYMFPGL